MRNPSNLRVYQMAIDLNDALADYHPRWKTPLAEAQ